MSDEPEPSRTPVGQTPSPEAQREAAILDVMIDNARMKRDRSRRVLTIVAVVLFFPIALPILLVWWIINRD